MFKPNPKKQVEITFQRLFGRGHKVEVTGGRMSPEQCAKAGYTAKTRDGLYLTELSVDGDSAVRAADRDWRKAYKKLEIEVEKLYAEGTLFAQ